MRHIGNFAHALPLEDRFFQQPLYVTHAGWEYVRAFQTYPRPGHPSYYQFKWEEGRMLGEFCLWFITRGRGVIDTRRGRQEIHEGQGCLYRPGEWHRHRPVPRIGWFNMWVNFNGELPHRWLREDSFHLDGNLAVINNRELFENQFRNLVETIHASGARNSLTFSWQAIGLLAHFLRDTTAADKPRPARFDDPIVNTAMDYIWSHSHNQIGVPDVAHHTGTNRRTLERRFKAATGTTLLNEIQRCRASRAALLLRETDAPLKYVIGRAGFAGYQQQRQTFHKHFGLSPESYRARQKSSLPGS